MFGLFEQFGLFEFDFSQLIVVGEHELDAGVSEKPESFSIEHRVAVDEFVKARLLGVIQNELLPAAPFPRPSFFCQDCPSRPA